MTAQDHLRCVRRLERAGQSVTCLCVVPLLLSFLYAKQQAFSEALEFFGIFAFLYAVDRLLLYRARSHLEHVGEQFKELFPDQR